MKRDALALCFAMTYPSLMSWIYFVALANGGGQVNVAVFVVYALGKGVQFAFPAVYCLLFDRGRFGGSWPNRRGLAEGITFGLVAVALTFALHFGWLRHTPLMEVAAEKILLKLREFGLATPTGFVLFGLFVSAIHSLFEEYYFRWFIFGLLRKYMRLLPAILISGVAFAAHHVILLTVYFPGGWEFVLAVVLLSLAVAGGGAVWAWIYHQAESLYAPWASHFIIDVGIMVVGYDLVGTQLGSG